MASFIQGDENSSANGTSLAIAFPSNIVANNLISVVIRYGTAATPTVTDSQANSYNHVITQAHATSGHTEAQYWAIAGSSAACTVTLGNLGNNGRCAIHIREFSGLATSTPVGDEISATGPDNGPYSPGTIDTPAAGVVVTGASGASAWPSGFTGDSDYTGLINSTGGGRLASLYRIVASAHNETITFSLSGTNVWTSTAVAYLDDTGGGVVPVIGYRRNQIIWT